MKSMTGYGFAEEHQESRTVSVEIRSYNSRYLDLAINLPSSVASLEQEIRSRVGARIRRGKVELTVRLRDFSQDLEISVDPAGVKSAYRALLGIREITGITNEPGFQDLLQIEGLLQVERHTDPTRYREVLVRLVDEALAEHARARESEGAATEADIRRQLDRIRTMTGVFRSNGAETEKSIFETIRARFREVLGDEADEGRMYAEAASLIVKYSINEEIVRLDSHLSFFDRTIDEEGAIGKKLDFVCQEINREINTMAGKALRAELQSAVIEAKDALESIREQVRNIE